MISNASASVVCAFNILYYNMSKVAQMTIAYGVFECLVTKVFEYLVTKTAIGERSNGYHTLIKNILQKNAGKGCQDDKKVMPNGLNRCDVLKLTT